MDHASVILDMDGILADLLPAWLARYNADYGAHLTCDVIRGWDLDPYVVPECGRDIYRYLRDPDLFRALAPVSGAVEGVAALRDAGVPLQVVSAAAPVLHSAKRDWLADHFGEWGLELAETAIFTAEKHRIPAPVFVDDSPGQQRSYCRAHPTAHVATLAYPYNTAWTGATRYPDWPHLVRGILGAWGRREVTA